MSEIILHANEIPPDLVEFFEEIQPERSDVLTIASQPYPESHFAVMPAKLVEPCVLAGTSPKVCELCGAPWRRVTEHICMMTRNGPKAGGYGSRTTDDLSGTMLAPAQTRTTGWQATCMCENSGTGRCIVLDPFMGAGTVALVALQYGRHYLGIEINQEYIDLAQQRVATVQPILWS
jgi:site-specific DNA-methyltransferase (adenine-specific)